MSSLQTRWPDLRDSRIASGLFRVPPPPRQPRAGAWRGSAATPPPLPGTLATPPIVTTEYDPITGYWTVVTFPGTGGSGPTSTTASMILHGMGPGPIVTTGLAATPPARAAGPPGVAPRAAGADFNIRYSELFEGRTSAQDNLWKRHYTRAFQAVTNYANLGAGLVRAYLHDSYGNPIAIGTVYQVFDSYGTLIERDFACFAQSIESDDSGADGCQWTVRAEYGHYDPIVFPVNPIDHPIIVSWEQQKFEVPFTQDINGNAVTNSTGLLFSDPPTIDESRWILTIQRNESTFDPDWAQAYTNVINSDTFAKLPPQSWKCASITSGEPVHDYDSGTGDSFYYKVTYKFESNPLTWKQSFLDCGYKKIDSATGKLVPIMDESNAEMKEPVPLDGHGQPLPTPTPGTPLAGVYLDYDGYPAVPFADFGFTLPGPPGQTWT